MGALKPMPTPQAVEVVADGSIRVVWRDGHVSNFAPRPLRLDCPCAACVDEWSGEKRLRPEDVADDLRAETVNRVGNYALSCVWSDGHSTGIYTYDRLRAACPCTVCAGA